MYAKNRPLDSEPTTPEPLTPDQRVGSRRHGRRTASRPRSPDLQHSEEYPEDVRRERWSGFAPDLVLAPLATFLRGETEQLSLRQTTHLAKISDRFVLDSRDALFYVSRSTPERLRDAADCLRLDLQEDILQHWYIDVQGAHQGTIRTYERLRKEFY
ncbi:hypothetical protein PHMEG_00013738 [Phytophthora megakarya]|uniref:Reverse transcriptase n=1 Tax=Phytophthora megakarya TaxID=4795 RepID=A0A225W611_9STRA|nr:hypothetical protein PHMEG_00013738 [Phytophthora megakarya]